MNRFSRAFLELIQSNLAFFIYCVLFLMLFSSVALESGFTYLGYLVLYFAVLVVAYFTFSRLIGIFLSGFFGHGKMEISRNGRPKLLVGTAFLICAVLLVIAHFTYLGHVPIITAYLEDGYYNIMLVRQSIFFEAPAFFRYVPNLLVKSVFPILLLYFFFTSKKKFWITIVVGSFYAVALLNKLFIVLLVIPLSIYFISRMRVWRALFLSIVPVVGVMLIVFAQNPPMRPPFWSGVSYQLSKCVPHSLEVESMKRVARTFLFPGEAQLYKEKIPVYESAEETALHKEKIPVYESAEETALHKEKIPVYESAEETAKKYWGYVDTVCRRVFIVPGQVVSAWFRRIPADIPFAEGCASRPVAWLKGCEFIFLPFLINDLENPVLSKRGIYGTMTAASFVEDYGNFGWKGLILGGLSLGLVLAIVGQIFGTSWRWLLAFNLIPISLLIELPLTTVLLSGGWLLSLLLYLVFHHDLERTVVDPAGSK